MPVISLERMLVGSKPVKNFINAAMHLINQADGQGGVADTCLALFSDVLDLNETDKQYRDLKRRLGIPVDDATYLAAVTDTTHLPEKPPEQLHADVVVSKDAAINKLFGRYTDLLDATDQNFDTPADFRLKMETQGSVTARIGGGTLGVGVRNVVFSILLITSVAEDVRPFEPEPPPATKKKPKKPSKFDEEEEPDSELDEEDEVWDDNETYGDDDDDGSECEDGDEP